MSDKMKFLAKQAEEICRNDKTMAWFLDVHIFKVMQNAEWLCERFPEADKDLIRALVWLHDIVYFTDISKIDVHAGLGAVKAKEMMAAIGIDDPEAEIVFEAIACHSCKGDKLPTSLEGKILATADAMAHFSPDFYLSLLIDGKQEKQTVAEFKQYALQKLERDFNGKKIFFDFAREKIRSSYEIMKKFFEAE